MIRLERFLSYGFSATLALCVSLVINHRASAQLFISDEERSARFVSEQVATCPVKAALRIPGRASIDRFVSLSGCSDDLIVSEQLAVGSPSFGSLPRPTPTIVIPGAAEQDRREAGQRPEDSSKSQDQQDNSRDAIPANLGPASFGMIRIAPEQPETPSPGLAETLDRLSFLRSGIGAVDITRKQPQAYRTDYDPHIAAAAYEHQIDPLLLHAIIWQESRYNRTARSHAGAIGLMQIMPATGKRFGAAKADLLDPMRNIDTGARLLRTLGARYRGNLDLMLSAYNAGEGAVARYGNRIPPFRETQNYVRKVKARYAALASGSGLSDGMQ